MLREPFFCSREPPKTATDSGPLWKRSGPRTRWVAPRTDCSELSRMICRWCHENLTHAQLLSQCNGLRKIAYGLHIKQPPYAVHVWSGRIKHIFMKRFSFFTWCRMDTLRIWLAICFRWCCWQSLDSAYNVAELKWYAIFSKHRCWAWTISKYVILYGT